MSSLLPKIFHLVDVFWNARISVPEAHHVFDEGNDVGGIETSAAQWDLVEELAEGHLIVVGGGVFEREDPGLLNDDFEEEAGQVAQRF